MSDSAQPSPEFREPFPVDANPTPAAETPPENERQLLTSSILLLLAGIFVLDLLLPRGVAAGVLYVAVVLLSLRSKSPRYTWTVTLGASVLTVLDFFLSPPAVSLWIVLTNRGLSLAAIWATAYLTLGAQRMAEVSRQQNEALEQSSDGIAIFNSSERIEFANAAFAKMHGYTEQEILRLSLSDLHSPEQLENEVRPFLQQMEHVGYNLGELHRVTQEKVIVETRTSASVLKNAHGIPIGYIMIAKDISAERALEAQLRQAQKMESIGRLAGGVAHDFNTLLNTILGNCEIVKEQIPDCRLREPIQQIQKAAARGAGLTRQLLAFSRQQTTQVQVVDLNALVRDLEPMLRRLLTEDIQIALELDPTLNHVKIDPGMIEQVVMNLVVNSSDAMPRGGKITIQTSNIQFDEKPQSSLIEIATGAYVALCIRDTGIGMDQATQNRVFEPFFTTKEAGRGTGLGLSLVYGIVQQNQGGLALESAPGKGTRICIYLPRTDEALAATPERESSPSKLIAIRGGATLLLVEDDASFRELLTDFLRNSGYRVLSAGTPQEALKQASQHSGEIQLLITDVVMPEMNGVELAAKLIEENPGLIALYISGYTDDILIDRAGAIAEHNFLHKPFGLRTLQQKIAALLQRAKAQRSARATP